MIMLSTRSPPIDVDSYLVQACAEYQSRSTVQLNSLRATLLYYEAYRALDHYRSAPYALIRAAGEVSGTQLQRNVAQIG